MNKQKQALCILIFSIFGWAHAVAQPILEDVVYLKNGTIIRGKLLKNSSDTVKIETFGRNVFVYPQSDVLTMQKEEKARKEKTQLIIPEKLKGFYSYTTLGMLIGKTEEENASTFSFNTSAGYQFNRYAGLGLGLGIESLKTEIMPMFLSFKSILGKGENSPFFHFQIGYSIPTSNMKKDDQDYNGTTYNYKGGVNVGFDFGIHSYRTSKRAFVIAAGYRYQFVEETVKYSYNPNYQERNTYDFNRLAVKIGFMFM